MSTNTLLTSVEAVIEIQENGVGTGARGILDVATDIKPALAGFTKSFGGITRNTRLSARTNKPVPRPVQRESPEPITAELTCKMTALNYMEHFDADSRFSLYVRHPERHPNQPLDYTRVDILTDVALESLQYGDLVADEMNTDDVVLTVPMNAAEHTRINPVTGTQLVTGFSVADDCNVVASAVDADGAIFAVTEADSVGTKPYLLKSEDDGGTWTETELTAITADCTAITVAGDYLVIAAGTTIAVYDKDGVQQSTYTAAGAIAALAAIDAANIIAAGAAGLLLTSDDGGNSWSALMSGVSTALNSIAVRHISNWYVGGAAGTMLHYSNGTIATITLPTAMAAATVNHIAIPESYPGFSRAEAVFVASSTGTVYGSDDNGVTWTEITYPGSGTGACTAIGFTGFLGQVLYILHTEAGGASVLRRDWSGGAGGNANAEIVTVPTNSGFNSLVVVDANNAYVFGDIHSTADLVVKVEA